MKVYYPRGRFFMLGSEEFRTLMGTVSKETLILIFATKSELDPVPGPPPGTASRWEGMGVEDIITEIFQYYTTET